MPDKEENIDIQMDVDLDALSSSDTGVTDVDTSIPGESSDTSTGPEPPVLEHNEMTNPEDSNEDVEYISKGGLDNLDVQMDKELGVEDSNSEESNVESEYVEENEDFETNTSNEEYEEVPYYNAPFDELRERIGEDFQIPEDVNEENYMDKLLDAVYENTDFEEYVHPDIRDLNAYMKNGGDMNNFVNSYNAQNNLERISNHDLMRARIAEESPDWTSEQVENVIEKMDNSGILDMEASRIRKNYGISREEISEKLLQEQSAQREVANKQATQDREEQINEAVEAFNQMDDVYGLPVSKAERQEFKETFFNLVTPDEKGVAPLVKMLQSNETLAKVAYILSKGDSAVRSALTNAKESTKEAFIEKLDPSPKTVAKSGSYEPDEVNLNALSAPERYHY